jgi:hypothetical protein
VSICRDQIGRPARPCSIKALTGWPVFLAGFVDAHARIAFLGGVDMTGTSFVSRFSATGLTRGYQLKRARLAPKLPSCIAILLYAGAK